MRLLKHGPRLALAAWLCAPLPALAAGIDDLLPEADPAAGEKVFRKCKACHTAEKDGADRVGPNLYGIVGSAVAAREGFAYSDALTAFGGEWTPERLDGFLERPKDAVPGTKMTFAGLRKEEDRADVIAYLNQNSDAPVDFAAASGGAGAGAEAAETEAADTASGTAADSAAATAEDGADTAAEAGAEGEFGVLVAAPGAEETYYACSACHSEMIVAQQGLTRDGWDKLLVWMVDEQGMSEIEEPDRTVILDYLAAHYGEDRPNFPQPATN